MPHSVMLGHAFKLTYSMDNQSLKFAVYWTVVFIKFNAVAHLITIAHGCYGYRRCKSCRKVRKLEMVVSFRYCSCHGCVRLKGLLWTTLYHAKPDSYASYGETIGLYDVSIKYHA